MTAAPVTPFDEGQFREAGLRWTGDEMDQDGHLPDYGYMMLDEFTRLVEASATLYGIVAAVVFTNTRGKAFFMGDVDGLGLVIGIPSHLAAFVTNAPTRNQIIADIARFTMKNLQNYKFFPSIAVARAWAYSSLVTVGARSSEAKTFSTMTVKPFLQFALECGCSPTEIMRACPFAPMPSKPRQKRKLVTATGSAIDSLLNDTAAAAARTEATAVHPRNMTDDLIAARDASIQSIVECSSHAADARDAFLLVCSIVVTGLASKLSHLKHLLARLSSNQIDEGNRTATSRSEAKEEHTEERTQAMPWAGVRRNADPALSLDLHRLDPLVPMPPDSAPTIKRLGVRI
ncbi:hypothetical protein M885DRAFT_625785 [Pelagophyceae sp. CCMP2097]|nr:hypothetical protein M885DRAFT_625785 [Pelagophyceae sp. CCMP2097]